MSHRRPCTLAALALTATLTATLGAAVVAGPAAASTVGTGEGCTPGYWKNHTASWQEYTPETLTSSLFRPGTPHVGSSTMLQSLQGGGGGGVSGAATILLRASTAATLNAAHDPLRYPLRRLAATPAGPAVLRATEAALRSGDRARMLELAATFDRLNNAGCPLS